MHSIITLYRIVYALALSVFLANVVNGIRLSRGTGELELLLLFAAGASLVANLYLVLSFNRSPAWLFWLAAISWCILFAWYAWYSQAAPFVGHEAHSLDPMQATAESGRHRLFATGLFVLLTAWFISLPFVRLKPRRLLTDVHQ
jgi:hypothetical protein